MYLKPGKSSKLTLEQDEYIYEFIDPIVTLTTGFDGIINIDARCYGGILKKKEENMETESLVDEIRNLETKKKKNKVKARKDRFPRDGGKPVKASVPGYSKIPWSKGTLTLIAQTPDGKIQYAKTMEEKKNLAWSNVDWILVCWPGQYSQDIFLIDDMKEFRRALGFKPVAETVKPVVTDEEGNEWIDALFEGNMAKTVRTYKNGLDDWRF